MTAKVIQMKSIERVEGPNCIYAYGETILANWQEHETYPVPRDLEGQIVRAGEFYEVTPRGIRRIE